MPNTVLLAGQPSIPQERVAAAAGILPGHLLEFGSGGNAGKLQVHATASGEAAPWFARESLTPDRSSASAPVDVAYQAGETVRWMQARPGDLIYALVPQSAAAIVTGDELVSNGDGTLKKYTAQASNESGTATYTISTNCVVARAAESVNNSAGATAARIRVYAV